MARVGRLLDEFAQHRLDGGEDEFALEFEHADARAVVAQGHGGAHGAAALRGDKAAVVIAAQRWRRRGGGVEEVQVELAREIDARADAATCLPRRCAIEGGGERDADQGAD